MGRCAVVLVAVAAFAMAAPAHAAQTFGSALGAPGTVGDAACANVCTDVQAVQAGATLGAPAAGVVTKVAVQSGHAGDTVHVRILRPIGDQFQAVAASESRTTADGLTTWAVRLRVQAGDHVGVNAPKTAVLFSSAASPAGDKAYAYDPGLGTQATGSNPRLIGHELLVQATLEPDADGDGFGDDTQDQCPTDPTTQGPCPTAGGGGAPMGSGAYATVTQAPASVRANTTLTFRWAVTAPQTLAGFTAHLRNGAADYTVGVQSSASGQSAIAVPADAPLGTYTLTTGAEPPGTMPRTVVVHAARPVITLVTKPRVRVGHTLLVTVTVRQANVDWLNHPSLIATLTPEGHPSADGIRTGALFLAKPSAAVRLKLPIPTDGFGAGVSGKGARLRVTLGAVRYTEAVTSDGALVHPSPQTYSAKPARSKVRRVSVLG